MADAFADYPWTRWTVAHDNHVGRIAQLQTLMAGEVVLPYGELWVAERNGALVAAAAWMRPDVEVPQYIWRDIEHQSVELAGDRSEQFSSAEALAATLRPATSHWYLGGVGVRTSAQGSGLGAAVLEPVLGRDGLADDLMYLETSTRANVEFYRRRGFVVSGQLTVPGGGPGVWAMTRVASGAN
ncbi:MAG: GCN5-related N-acetyltransferase [Jatrophihabitantaceae bacterium]|nr:GCN5-related N-acetyltransferase [Jatrophihabitantaceae bacterium]